jgi:hypothetical protein
LFRSSRTGTFEFTFTTSCSRSPPVAPGAQLGPGDLWVDAAPQAAGGASDDVFAADEFSERDDAIGYQFRVLDEVGGVADNTGNQDFPGGEFSLKLSAWDRRNFLIGDITSHKSKSLVLGF